MVHSKIVQDWEVYEDFFSWPLEVTIGTGPKSYQREFHDSLSYKHFLMTEESLESFTETEVELLALAHILKTNIFVLSYNVPKRKNSVEKCVRWSSYLCEGIDLEETKFSCNSVELYLLQEHMTHYSKIIEMVDSSTTMKKNLKERFKESSILESDQISDSSRRTRLRGSKKNVRTAKKLSNSHLSGKVRSKEPLKEDDLSTDWLIVEF